MKIRASFTGSAGGSPALNAQRSNRSAADPAAVRGATRSPISAKRESFNPQSEIPNPKLKKAAFRTAHLFINKILSTVPIPKFSSV
jgi:hypothetical protein